jgi:putative ABC transport system permease protein
MRPIDEGLIDVVADVDGVGEISAVTQSMKIVPSRRTATRSRRSGHRSCRSTGPTAMNPLTLVAGTRPDAPGEFAIDEGTADRDGFVLGETFDVIGAAGREPFVLVGLTRFGDENSLAGAVLVSFTLDEVQRLDGSEGTSSGSTSSADGVEPDVLIDRLERRAARRRRSGSRRRRRPGGPGRLRRRRQTSSATSCSRSRSSRCS